MATKKLSLRNRSKIFQYVLVNNQRYQIPPFEVTVLDEDIAKAFLQSCAPWVGIAGGDAEVEPDTITAGGKTVYLFNATGNPDAPATVKVSKYQKGGGTALVDVVNPQKQPIYLRWKGETTYVADIEPDGTPTSRRVTSSDHVLEPYTRHGFRESIAKRILDLDGGASEEMRFAAKRARDPQAWEPNEFWSLDYLRYWARIVDASIPIDEVPGLDETEEDVHRRLWRRCWFRLADPRYRIPSQEEFETFVKAKQVELPGLKESQQNVAVNVPAVPVPSKADVIGARLAAYREERMP